MKTCAFCGQEIDANEKNVRIAEEKTKSQFIKNGGSGF